MPPVGFIGLGAMGRPMCRNIIKSGYQVRAFDANPEAAASVHTVVASSITDCVSDVDIVITMLPNSPQVEDVALSAGGLLESMQQGSIWIDMSSISPGRTKILAARAEKHGIRMLDAPVSGGVNGAESGTLSIMVGGSQDTLADVLDVLSTMGDTITLCGDHGAGQGTKACNQVVVANTIMAACEGLALAKKFDLDLEAVRNVWSAGAAGSWMIDHLVPKMLAGDDSAGFRIDLQLKDLAIALESAHDLRVPLPGTSLVESLYLTVAANGGGSFGNQSLSRAYELLSGVKFADEEPE